MFARRFPSAGAILLTLPIVMLFLTAPASSQDPPKSKVEDIQLTTADKVRLEATFYPGRQGKDTVPVVLLHMYKGNRNDYNELAPFLQSKGHAVLVPDLRGHGDSTSKEGLAVPLKATSLSSRDFMAMVNYDLPTLKQFLIGKNNSGQLNLEKLCLVGAEMGASVALSYTYNDWTRATVGNTKQGQDVKAVAVISPEWSAPGPPLKLATTGRPLMMKVWGEQWKPLFRDPEKINFNAPVTLDWRREVSVMIIVGEGKSGAVRDAKRLQTILKGHHPDPPASERAAKKDLFYGTIPTSLQGTKILGQGLKLEEFIAHFIELRLVNRQFPWAERKNPYAR